MVYNSAHIISIMIYTLHLLSVEEYDNLVI